MSVRGGECEKKFKWLHTHSPPANTIQFNTNSTGHLIYTQGHKLHKKSYFCQALLYKRGWKKLAHTQNVPLCDSGAIIYGRVRSRGVVTAACLLMTARARFIYRASAVFEATKPYGLEDLEAE